MLVTVQGTYENGTIRLDEPVPTDTARVLVTFLVETAVPAPARPRFSFDEALALPTTPGSSVSDAVAVERAAGW